MRALLLLLAKGRDQLVVGLHGRLGLDEDRLAALRAVVDDPAHPLPGLGAHRQDVAPVANGHEPVGEQPVTFRLQEPLEIGDDPSPPVTHLLPERAEPGTRAVGEGAVVFERVAERVAEVGQAGEVVGEPGQVGADGGNGLTPGFQPGPGLEYRDQQDQLGAFEQAAFGGAPLEHGPDVGDAVQRGRTLGACSRRFTGERNADSPR
jgi:hypothetical protein